MKINEVRAETQYDVSLTDAEVDAFIRLISSTTYTERRILVTRSTEYEESHDKLLRGMWLDLEEEFLSPK